MPTEPDKNRLHQVLERRAQLNAEAAAARGEAAIKASTDEAQRRIDMPISYALFDYFREMFDEGDDKCVLRFATEGDMTFGSSTRSDYGRKFIPANEMFFDPPLLAHEELVARASAEYQLRHFNKRRKK